MSHSCQVSLAGQGLVSFLHLDFNVQLAIENLSLEPLGEVLFQCKRFLCVRSH